MTAPALEVASVEPTPWPLAKRIGFRFLFVYWLLYLLPFPIGALPGTDGLAEGFNHGQEKVIIWMAAHVLRLKTLPEAHPTGSGDTLLAWVGLAVNAIIAAIVTIAWSALSKRTEHRKLAGLLRIYLRYSLGFIMLSYGLLKVFPVQFSPNDPARLMEPYGQFSPMGVVWAMMGASSAYSIATGIGESLGGVLLFFRRTAGVGALILLAVVANVVLLNFCFDVPVKQYSLHLWLMALYLAWPDLRPLLDLLVRRKRVEPAAVGWRIASRRWHIAARITKYAFAGWLVFTNVSGGIQGYRERGAGRTPKPWEGIWQVEDRSGGAPHWQRIGLGAFRAAVATDTDPYERYGVEFDGNLLKLRSFGDPQDQPAFAIRQPDADHLTLDGPFVLTLRRVDPSKIILTSRGFHWIQEYPFNR